MYGMWASVPQPARQALRLRVCPAIVPWLCECLVCLSCIQACEYGALRYAPYSQAGLLKRSAGSSPRPSRRTFCLSLAAGTCLGLVQGVDFA